MAAVAMTEMQKTGKVTQVIGPVVDVEFPPGALPEIYTALTLSNVGISTEPDNLTVEVAQHLGENTARCIAMDSTEGLIRGQPVTNTGADDAPAGGHDGSFEAGVAHHRADERLFCQRSLRQHFQPGNRHNVIAID